jgi:hypothetical protein
VDLSFICHPESESPSKIDPHPDAEVAMKSEETKEESPSVLTERDAIQLQLQSLEISVQEQSSSGGTNQREPATNSGASSCLAPSPAPTTPSSGITSTTTGASSTSCGQDPTSRKRPLRFALEEFVFQTYPVSCLNCKRLKHSILECPELDLAAKYRDLVPAHLPSGAALKWISYRFAEHMIRELPDELDLRKRKEILRLILADIYPLYPDAQLQMFGSSANGFGSKNSDLDICLTLPGHDKVYTHVPIPASPCY